MFYYTGIAIAFFLALLLLSKKNKTQADKILVCWLIVMGLHLSLYVLRYVQNDMRYSFLLGLEIPFPLLHGPFLYLYTAATTNQLPANKKSALLHFLTPVLLLLLFTKFFILTSAQKVEVYRNKGAGWELPVMINTIAIYISGVFYVAWCSILLRKHRKNIADEFSNTDKINLNWLRYLVYGIGAIWLVVLIGQKDEWIFATVVLFVILLGFFGIKQVGIFTHTNHPVKETSIEKQNEILIEEDSVLTTQPVLTETGMAEPVTEKKKYLKSGLTEEQSEKILKELNHLMEKERLYTESEITLTELAARLNVHPNYLSQVINEKEQTNFYDYINTLRIEEFKKLAAQPDNKKYTLLSLAYECGFNSKSSFNRYFKKVAGTSPSEFMRSL